MALFRYEPLRLVSQLQDDVDRVFTALSAPQDEDGPEPEWRPPVDIAEYADRFELAVDLPGVDPDQVDVTLEEGVLTLSGKRDALMQGDAAQPAAAVRTLVERGHGRFHRRFVLPELVDAERVQASGRNGVLSITIPKQAKALPRKIKIAA